MSKKQPLRCRLFGHKVPPPGWWGDIPYVSLRRGPTDNIGRIHGEAFHTCDRCGEKFRVGRIHLNDPVITEALEAHALPTPAEARAQIDRAVENLRARGLTPSISGDEIIAMRHEGEGEIERLKRQCIMLERQRDDANVYGDEEHAEAERLKRIIHGLLDMPVETGTETNLSVHDFAHPAVDAAMEAIRDWEPPEAPK